MAPSPSPDGQPNHDEPSIEASPDPDSNAPTRTWIGPTPTTGEAGVRLRSGQAFGPYRIDRLLGRGGMGEVYEAEHLDEQRRVAVKVLSRRLDRPEDRERFLREGRLAASISHPRVVYVFGSAEINGLPTIVMENFPLRR